MVTNFSAHFVLGFQGSSIYTLHLCFGKNILYYKMVRSLYKKATSGLKNHMRNLDNFRQAVESPKSWNFMRYFCPKNTFLWLKHIRGFIQHYFQLLAWKLIHQMTYVILKPYVIFHDKAPLYFFSLNITYFLKK